MDIEMKESSVLDRFFSDWESETVQWYWWIKTIYHKNYKGFKEEIRPQIGKTVANLIVSRNLLPRAGCGKSIQEMVEEDMENRKAKLVAKIKDKVGEIIQLDLYCGEDGTPNGTVTGTEGAVRITTIVAGGYNIQCAHYRVLVK
ncbi:hypothetical protein [Paenibacillus sp. P46E]|uniref:hypothetical protein n=1 Tax=Paenibacillus sp. P46E TaxID=1349436 RepID=UPI00093BB32F|nr:hypothetical protein [Paenibacillus sp. P46E]OKP96835.1 hypothetical protein A3849_19105 [Paenibacillus sp. P46E]